MHLPADDPRLMPVSLRRELLAIGHTDRTLAAALRTGRFERARRGAYVDGPTWRALGDEQKYAVRCRAVERQAVAGVVLSHVSALPFQNAPLWGFDLDDVHLTRTDGRAGRRESGVRRHCGILIDGDVEEVHGSTVMSSLRASLEVSMLAHTEAALAVTNFFLHRGDFTPAQLRARYDESMECWPDSGATDLMIRLADPRPESVGESRTAYFLFVRRFPRPTLQYEVKGAGDFVARLDFAYPDLGFWIEFDGRVKYERYVRPGETAVDAVIREKKREQKVAELTGWRCFRVTWADLENPDRLERRLREFMASVANERSRRMAS